MDSGNHYLKWNNFLEVSSKFTGFYIVDKKQIKISDISKIISKWGTDFNIPELIELYPHKINFLVPYTQPLNLEKVSILVFSEGGETKLAKMEIYELASIW